MGLCTEDPRLPFWSISPEKQPPSSPVSTVIKWPERGEPARLWGCPLLDPLLPERAGVLILMLIANPMAEFVLKFGPPEYFSVMVLGLTLLIYLAHGSRIKAPDHGLFWSDPEFHRHRCFDRPAPVEFGVDGISRWRRIGSVNYGDFRDL